MARSVFERYVREVVLAYIQSWREQTGKHDARGLIIFDGHASHMSDILRAYCAMHQVDIVCLPPHSSHLLQPLDRLYFSRLKQLYSQSFVGANLGPVIRALLRVVVAFDTCASRYLICESWSMTGIHPIVTDREVTGVQPEPDRLQEATAMQHAPAPRCPRGERIERAQWGLLTEDERMILEAGQCPFCFAELPADWNDN